MKKFVLNVNLFLIPIGLVSLLLLYSIDGYSDPFYLRFTTPKQNSLILGTSRAAQGIQPRIINEILQRNDVYNYSFTRNDSPYGQAYFNSIQQKVNPKTKNGIFILAVDAWSISSDTKDPNDANHFEELHSFIAQVSDVNSSPNVFYLCNFYQNPFGRLISKNKQMLLHDDGWLEVSIDIRSVSEKEITNKISIYRKDIFPYYQYSPTRLSYLNKTINHLKQFGKVYLVRLPMHPKMMQLDDALVPNLNQLMGGLSEQNQVPYLDLTPQNSRYQYTDGNHLYKESGRKVSQEIADWIARQ